MEGTIPVSGPELRPSSGDGSALALALDAALDLAGGSWRSDRGQLERRLARAALDEHRAEHADRSQQRSVVLRVAVVGATNAGKSTIVNLLLDRPMASMSVLARHTQHATVFLPPGLGGLPARRFPGYERSQGEPARLTDDALASGRYHRAIVVRSFPASGGTSDWPGGFELWDAPDFSTEASDAYSDAVLRCCAASDIVVYVFSAESYADSLGLMLWRGLGAMGVERVVVANKAAEAPELLADMASLLEREPGTIAALPMARGMDPGARFEALRASDGAGQLREAIGASVRRAELVRARVERARAAWLASSGGVLLAPVAKAVAEHEERVARLRRLADDAAALFAERARRSGRHPEFDRALERVMRLIEPPVIGVLIRTAGSVVRMPAAFVWKQLRRSHEIEAVRPALEVGRCVACAMEGLERELRGSAAMGRSEPGEGGPMPLLRAIEAVRGAGIERALGPSWEEHERRVRDEIDRSANLLHEQIVARPALLASLRASHAALGIGSAAAVIASHGVGWADAVLAPVAAGVQHELVRLGMGAVIEQHHESMRKRMRELVRELVLSTIAPALERELPPMPTRQLLDAAMLEASGMEPLAARSRASMDANGTGA